LKKKCAAWWAMMNEALLTRLLPYGCHHPRLRSLQRKVLAEDSREFAYLKTRSEWERIKRVPKRDFFKQNQTGYIVEANRQIHPQSNFQNAARFTYGIVRPILLDIEADMFLHSNRPSSFFAKEQTLHKATPSCFPTYRHALPSRRPFRVPWGLGEWTN